MIPRFLHKILAGFFHCLCWAADHEQALCFVETTRFGNIRFRSVQQIGALVEGCASVIWVGTELVSHGRLRLLLFTFIIIISIIFLIFFSIFVFIFFFVFFSIVFSLIG